jgi:hypothetical protein
MCHDDANAGEYDFIERELNGVLWRLCCDVNLWVYENDGRPLLANGVAAALGILAWARGRA